MARPIINTPPSAPRYCPSGDLGVHSVGKLITGRLGWIFRHQPSADTGIDAEVEIIDQGRATGRLLKMQVKSGVSYFSRRCRGGWTFHGAPKHLDYWMKYALPVVLVLHDPQKDVAYWMIISESTVRRTARGWRAVVLRKNVLDETAREDLIAASRSHEIQVAKTIESLLDQAERADAVNQAAIELQDPKLASEVREYLRIIQWLQPAKATIRELVESGVLHRARDVRYAAEFGEFKIISQVGRGGMGVVFKAYEPSLERLVALKLLRPQHMNDEKRIQRFKQEARIAAKFNHPNTINVYRFGHARGAAYLVVEFIDGHSLSEIIGGAPVDPSTIVRTFRQVLWALDAIHAAGYIHRDIKPSNILIEEATWRVRVTDFGLAAATSNGFVEPSIERAGTPQYMSPEQAGGQRRLDCRTDLYSAGVVLYEMLSGRRPFEAATWTSIVERVVQETPAYPISRGSGAQAQLARIAMRLMEKSPSRRYKSARAALMALETIPK